MNILCKVIGGSTGYGLSTSASDIDIRGVFLSEEIGTAIGLERLDQQQSKGGGKDMEMYELRHFFHLLTKGSTQAIELLFHENLMVNTPLWSYIVSQRHRLMNYSKLYSSLKGHGQSDLNKWQRECIGTDYDNKPLVQVLRLYWAGEFLFARGIFPVRVDQYDENAAQLFRDIREYPMDFKVEELKAMALKYEARMDEAYASCEPNDHTFDRDLANNLCALAYRELIEEACDQYWLKDPVYGPNYPMHPGAAGLPTVTMTWSGYKGPQECPYPLPREAQEYLKEQAEQQKAETHEQQQ